ncbi:MAG: DNA-binding NarL/FixJ family response regulator [Pseudohongiellaceae bacterium]|jgi:DNA-binding NarL/FixJ family response regulator
MTVRVAIVDDQALVRGGLSMILDHQVDIDVIAECSNGLEAIEIAKAHKPDVILMDIRMPEMDGLTAMSIILGELKLPVRVVILSTFDLDEYVYKALKAGASGFILKDTPPEELIAAVYTVASGGALLAPSITKRLIGAFAKINRVDATISARIDLLTSREKEILINLALGFNNTEIASRLFISEATVKSHVSNVLSKLGLRDRAQAVIFAYESGIVSVGEPNVGS